MIDFWRPIGSSAGPLHRVEKKTLSRNFWYEDELHMSWGVTPLGLMVI
jgi:hypothetical protein